MADYAIHEETLLAQANILRKKFGTNDRQDPADYPAKMNLMGPLEEKTVSGSVVAFSDGADAVLLKSCAVTIAPNIDGVSSVDVVKGGYNFIDASTAEYGNLNINTGNVDTTSTSWKTTDFMPLFAGDFIFTWVSSSTYFQVKWVAYDSNKTRIDGESTATWTSVYSKQFTFPTGTAFVRFCWSVVVSGNPVTREDIRLNRGSVDLGYTPYVQPTIHTANLGRTIYGGQADVENGTGTDGYINITFDGSESGWRFGTSSDKNRVYIELENAKASVGSFVGNYIEALNSAQGYPSEWKAWINASSQLVIGVPSTITSKADWQAYLAQNNLIVSYEKATPEDFTFTPVPINSRLGDNTLWSDGDLSVVYRSSGTQTLIPPTLISKTITANGTYSAEDDGADGYDAVVVNVSGGGGNTPEATQTLICDNSALGSTLTFTDDYENYDLIKFVVYRSDIGNQFTFYMTPAMINAMGQYSSNRINFNQPYGNNFVCYTKTSNTAWTRYGVRNLAVKYVYGLTFTNCTVTETELYNRQGIGSSNVTFTPPTGETFFDYDYILLATCTGNSDETQANLEVFQPDIEKDIFGSDNADENSVRVYKYNQGGTFVTVTENTITAFSYFYACGLKLSYNQQNLLGGFNSNSEQGEQENEIENELNELEQEESET